jgi:hypothetical protein
MIFIFAGASLFVGGGWTLLMAFFFQDPFAEIFPFGLLFGFLFVALMLGLVFWQERLAKQLALPLGQLTMSTGNLMICDPANLALPHILKDASVEYQVPRGQFPLTLTVKHYADKRQSIQRPLWASLSISPLPPQRKELLGTVPCQSGTVALVDSAALAHFNHVGPDRIGLFVGPDHAQAAESIRDKFQLTLHQESDQVTRIQEPLDQNLAEAIPIFLKGQDKASFLVKTNSSFDLLADQLLHNQVPIHSHANLVLNPETGDNIFVLSLSSKDETCQVFGHYIEDNLVALGLEL